MRAGGLLVEADGLARRDDTEGDTEGAERSIMSKQDKETVMPLEDMTKPADVDHVFWAGWKMGIKRQQNNDWSIYRRDTEALRQQARRLAEALVAFHENVCGCKLEDDVTLCDAQEIRLAIMVYKEAQA